MTEEPVVRRAMLGVLAGVVLVGCSGGEATVTATADPAAGEALYANNCARCHGADLQGTENGPPHLDPVYEPGHHGDEAFRLAIARGAPQHHWDFGPMPAIDGLAEGEVDDIIAYVRQEQRRVGIE